MKGSLVGRGVVALVLMALFYALAIGAAIGLGLLGVGLFSVLAEVGGGGFSKLLVALVALTCVGAAGVIIWSVLPRVDELEPPGPELDRGAVPELFAELDRLAEVTGQAAPRHVYLVHDVNAFVTERGGVMGIGSRRVMGIGLPLFGLLTVSQLRGVLAHELGHFYGGDTKLGPWIYKTREAVGRTVVNLARAAATTEGESGAVALIGFTFGMIQKPFLWFGQLFMRITQAISRAQEYSADALAARVVGAAPMVEGLERATRGEVAYVSYFDNEVAPLVEAGYRPPVVAGFIEFLAQDSLGEALDEVLAEELEAAEDPYDSHPPLRERIAALESLADPGREERDDRLALELVSDVALLERALLDFMTVESLELDDLAWDQALERVYIPAWRENVGGGKAFEGVAFVDVPARVDRFAAELVVEIGESVRDVPDELVRGWAASRIAEAICVCLLDRGFAASSSPGAPITLCRDDLVVEPWPEVWALLDGETTAETWRARCAELGIDQATIGGGTQSS